MKSVAKAMIIAAILIAPLFATGCVYVPARPYAGAVWVPAHWAGEVWVRGHWR